MTTTFLMIVQHTIDEKGGLPWALLMEMPLLTRPNLIEKQSFDMQPLGFSDIILVYVLRWDNKKKRCVLYYVCSLKVRAYPN